MCDNETQENTHLSEVGGRKESIRLINDNLKKKGIEGTVVARSYRIVKIPRAQTGYTGLNSGMRGKDK